MKTKLAEAIDAYKQNPWPYLPPSSPHSEGLLEGAERWAAFPTKKDINVVWDHLRINGIEADRQIVAAALQRIRRT